MAHHDHTRFLALLHTLISPATITFLARHHGWLERRREFDPVVFVWTLILGFSSGARRSIATLHRSYQRHSGSDVSYSAFYQRLDASLLATMTSVLRICMSQRSGRLGAFEDILALDATLIRLWDALAPKYPSTAAHQACAKLHVVMSLVSMSPNRVKIRTGREHDLTAWKSMGPWVQNRLLLMDLGYHSAWLFHRIDAHGGFFLSRLKTNSALVISKDLRTGSGRRSKVAGKSLSTVLKRLKSKHIEFEVEVPVKLRSGRQVVHRWRVLGQWNEDTRRYHTYLTNAPNTLIECEDARGLYALRWQVELLFKGLKECGRLHQLPSRDEAIVKVLIMAALCWMCLAGLLRHVLIRAGERVTVGVLRTARILREWGDELLGALARRRPSFKPRDSLKRFRAQLCDPNDMRERAFAIPALVDYSCDFES